MFRITVDAMKFTNDLYSQIHLKSDSLAVYTIEYMIFKKYFFILICLPFFSVELHAEIIKHEISSAKNYEYSLRELCETMGSKNNELISANSLLKVDCMGKIFKAIDFCIKKLPLDMGLTRGIIDEKNKKVTCETASSITLSLSCDARNIKYCYDSHKGCEELKKIYAYQMEVVHASVLEKKINCYFSKHIGESLNEL